ncbi:hypothetical protein GBA52_012845 [Prunus armeniaca]|nr:hypothetical protein GBA52_012845 [Prunus armeniaca]
MLMRDPIEERPEELPRRTIKATNTYGAYGQLVVEPPNDFISAVVYQQHPKEDDADVTKITTRCIQTL